MTWMGKAQQIRRQNMKVNAVAGKLFSMLREDGMRCCVLKGQGNALMYPNPYSRTPGDIDVWIDASRERIMEYAQKKFALAVDVRLQHLETSLDGVPVDCRNGFEGMRICNAQMLLGCPMGLGILLYQRRHLMLFIS